MKELKNFAVSLSKLCLLVICLLLVPTTNGDAADVTELIPPYLFLTAENTEDVEVQKSPFIVRSRLVDLPR